MKVVIFCGGQGLRMREASDVVPKPMVPIGNRPVLWHVMKYYAHFGFTDFVLCLGYKAEAIKHFFLTYNEAMANDFVLSEGGAQGPSAQDRHPQLEHHVRRHRASRLHRRAAARGPPPAPRRRDVPRQLRRHAHRRRSAGDDRQDQGDWCHGQLPRGATELQLPRRIDGRQWDRRRHPRRDEVGRLDQRRLLRAALGASGRHPARRGARRGALPSTAGSRSSCWPSATKASGRRWTRSRTSSGSRACTKAVKRRGSGGLLVKRLTATSPQRLADAAASRARGAGDGPLRLLAIGAHSDDIEIGCGGTILKLIEQGSLSEVCWVVLTGETKRAAEAGQSADGAARRRRTQARDPQGLPGRVLPL